MAKAIRFRSYENHYLLVDSISDLSLLIKILVENKIFELEVGHDIKKTEFVDFFAYKSRKIELKDPLKKY